MTTNQHVILPLVLISALVTSLTISPAATGGEDEGFEHENRELIDPMARLSAAQRVFFKKQFPALVKHVEALVADTSEGARDKLREYRHFLREMADDMIELNRDFPEAFKLRKRILTLDLDCEHLGDRIRDTDPGGNRDEMIDQLRQMLAQVFDLKQKERKLEAQQIERELREIRSLIEKRQDQRDRIIDRRLADLTGHAELYEW